MNVEVPFIFKHAVDYLNAHTGEVLSMSDPSSSVTTVAAALMIGCKSYNLLLRYEINNAY